MQRVVCLWIKSLILINAFILVLGADIVQWLIKNLNIEDPGMSAESLTKVSSRKRTFRLISVSHFPDNS